MQAKALCENSKYDKAGKIFNSVCGYCTITFVCHAISCFSNLNYSVECILVNTEVSHSISACKPYGSDMCPFSHRHLAPPTRCYSSLLMSILEHGSLYLTIKSVHQKSNLEVFIRSNSL